MSQIDWSKAPEGYPLWLEDIIHPAEDSKSCWAREGQGEYELPGGGFWSYSVENLHYMVYRRPLNLSEQCNTWNGEGLPPVGTVCEYLEDGNGDWEQVRIVAIDQQLGHTFAVYSGNKGYSGDRRAELFRPIRTPEQIAIEIRSKAITQLMCDLDVPTAIATRAYDKGYRKFEIVEGK